MTSILAPFLAWFVGGMTSPHTSIGEEEGIHSLSAIRSIRSNSSGGGSLQRQRGEIIHLKNSLPSRTELLRVLESDPAEGERLARYCQRIKDKIRDLEVEYQESLRRHEALRLENARARAAEERQAKHQATVAKFMDKTLSAEDRSADLDMERQRKLEAKKAIEYVRRIEADEERQRIDQERSAALEQQKTSWNRAIAMVSQHREKQRQSAAARVEKQKSQEEARRRKERSLILAEQERLNALARHLDSDVVEHSRRHVNRLADRRAHAMRFAHASIAHPEVPVEELERRRAKLEQKEQMLATSSSFVVEKKQHIAEWARVERERRLAQARERHRRRLEEEQRRAREVDDALKERLHAHQQRIEEQHRERQAKADHHGEKMQRCQTFVAESQERKNASLSKKIIDRTLRIGSALGVDCPPVLPPSTLFITASVMLPEKVPRGRPSSAEQIEKKPRQRSRLSPDASSPPRSESAPPNPSLLVVMAAAPGHSSTRLTSRSAEHAGDPSPLSLLATLLSPESHIRLIVGIPKV